MALVRVMSSHLPQVDGSSKTADSALVTADEKMAATVNATMFRIAVAASDRGRNIDDR